MSGDQVDKFDEGVVFHHKVMQTLEVKWLCIEDIYQKFHRPNLYDIGGTYSQDVADYWFLCKTERVGNIFLLHLLICNNQGVSSFNVAVSFSNDISFDKDKNIAYLSKSLKNYHFTEVKERMHNYITTYNFTDFDIELLKEKALYISISFTNELATHKESVNNLLLKHDMSYLLLSPICSDFTVESSDGEKFKVHKAILCAHSEVFKAMLKDDTAESLNNYVKLEVGKEDLGYLLEFIYSGTIKNLLTCNFINLLMLADLYNIQGLQKLCEYVLSEQINVDNVFDIMVVADMYNSDLLKISTLRFIKINAVLLHNSTIK